MVAMIGVLVTWRRRGCRCFADAVAGAGAGALGSAAAVRQNSVLLREFKRSLHNVWYGSPPQMILGGSLLSGSPWGSALVDGAAELVTLPGGWGYWCLCGS